MKILHTADWHLGMTFPAFDADARLRLSRARLEVVDRILGLAERHVAHAVLCAGDLFDDPDPPRQWWEGLAQKLSARRWTNRTVFATPAMSRNRESERCRMRTETRSGAPGSSRARSAARTATRCSRVGISE